MLIVTLFILTPCFIQIIILKITEIVYKIQAFGNFYWNWNPLETSKDMITICEDTASSRDKSDLS